MEDYHDLADDFYCNMNLSTEMDLSCGRETILHFVEQIQKKFPSMRNFYAREPGSFVLEEEKDGGKYRWCSVETRRLCSGFVNPPQFRTAMQQHAHTLELAPYLLTLSPLDCEALDLLIGFDFNYCGNQNQLIAEALGVCPAYESLASVPGATFVNHEPTITFSLDDDCRIQCRVGVEARTNAYQIRTGEFQEEQLSVYVTARQYGSLPVGTDYASALDRLGNIAQDVIENYVADSVLEPLARAIALE